MSVGASSSGVSASMRATSTATLPFPITTARSPDRSNSSSWKSGWPLYQATNSVAGHEPGRSSPGMPMLPVGLGADRVDDRVVVLEQLAVQMSRPTSTLPRKRKPGCSAIFSNARETDLIFGWSGATPSRTSPHGVGSRSIMSTSTGMSAPSSAPAA